jgi:hypothetical protein
MAYPLRNAASNREFATTRSLAMVCSPGARSSAPDERTGSFS